MQKEEKADEEKEGRWRAINVGNGWYH